jgi:hypothetical protein
MQERTESGKTEAIIEHRPIDSFLINTHAFHNAHLIRAVLPRDLTCPIPYTVDRVAHHRTLALALRVSQDGKRATTALKAAEKRKAAAIGGTARASGNKRKRGAVVQDDTGEPMDLDERPAVV